MTVQPFLVAPQEIGLELDMQPWILPDSAYVTVEDAYLFRLRGKRRRGNKFLGRLVEDVSKTYVGAVTGADITWNNTVDPLASQPVTNVLIDTPAVGSTRIVFGSNTIATGESFIMNGIGGTVGTVLNNIRFNAGATTGTTVDLPVTSTGLVYGAGGTAYLDSIQPTSVFITIGAYTFMDDGVGGFSGSGTGTINYFTGAITLNFAAQGGGPFNVVIDFSTFPCLPSMALETWETILQANYDLIAFDTRKANLFNSPTFDDITFYNGSGAPFSWTGTDTDFFSSLNFQNAFFATNGTFGYQTSLIASVTIDSPAAGFTRIIFPPAVDNQLQPGDTVFITGILGTVGTVLNDLSFVVTTSVTGLGGNIVLTVVSTGLAYISGGTLFAITGSLSNGDGLRWYANDSNVNGWVNFSPPTDGVNALKGGNILIAYRGRMMVLNTIEGLQNNPGDQVRYRNRVRWSGIGTCFYINPVPQNQTADIDQWRDDIPGRGGFADAPTAESITGGRVH